MLSLDAVNRSKKPVPRCTCKMFKEVYIFSEILDIFLCLLYNSSLKSGTIMLPIYFYRDAAGKFPEYPDDDDGGSAAIFKQKDPAEVEAELAGKV